MQQSGSSSNWHFFSLFCFCLLLLLYICCESGGTHHMATRQTTEYLNSTNGYKTGQRFVDTCLHSSTLSQSSNWVGDRFFRPSTSDRSVTTSGGTRSPRSSLKMTPCWPLRSVWRTDPNATVRTTNSPLSSHCVTDASYWNISPWLYFFVSSSKAIGRTLIPRYFRSIFEGGATELYYVLKHPKESFHNNFVSLDCDQCTMVTQNGKPMFTQVCACVF